MLFKDTPIERKITAVIMLTTVSALILAMVTLFVFDLRESRIFFQREISSISDILGANIAAALTFDDSETGSQMLSVLKRDPRIVSAEVYDLTGKVFVNYGTGETGSMTLSEPSIVVSKPIILDGAQIGTIVVRATSQQLIGRLISYSVVLTIALLISTGAAFFLSSILRNLISAPILHLADVAKQISHSDNITVRATKSSNDETGVLIDQFNAMLDQMGRKNAELEEHRSHLAESEHQLRLITDALPVLISYVDAESRYQFVNAAYENWFGLKRDHFKGRMMSDVWGPALFEIIRGHVQRALQGRTVIFETPLTVPGSAARHISGTYIPDIGQDGRVEGFFALISDISERKRQEDELRVLNNTLELRVNERTKELQTSQEQLRKSERLASIGTLAAGIAHEIRNPLNTISLATQFAMRSEKEIAPSIKEVLGVVENESRRCADIIKNVLLFAKFEKTVKTVQDLNLIVPHALDIAKTYTKEKFVVDFQPLDRPALVVMNQTEIEQVIVNLIGNAIEASAATALITVKLEDRSAKIVLSVRDNGPGIPSELLNHIFDPFFSTKRQRGNTGLGLSISHGIIRDHQGEMRVQSEIGKGTVFTLEFPMAGV